MSRTAAPAARTAAARAPRTSTTRAVRAAAYGGPASGATASCGSIHAVTRSPATVCARQSPGCHEGPWFSGSRTGVPSRRLIRHCRSSVFPGGPLRVVRASVTRALTRSPRQAISSQRVASPVTSAPPRAIRQVSRVRHCQRLWVKSHPTASMTAATAPSPWTRITGQGVWPPFRIRYWSAPRAQAATKRAAPRTAPVSRSAPFRKTVTAPPFPSPSPWPARGRRAHHRLAAGGRSRPSAAVCPRRGVDMPRRLPSLGRGEAGAAATFRTTLYGSGWGPVPVVAGAGPVGSGRQTVRARSVGRTG